MGEKELFLYCRKIPSIQEPWRRDISGAAECPVS
jgi:hypothetical protein